VSDFAFHEPGPDDESHKDYVYHATNAYGAHGMADDGHLHVHRPWHGTDQRTWPDGSKQKRAYFSRDAGGVHWFAPEEGPHAVVRVHKDNHPFRRESTGDVYTTKKTPAKHVEVRHKDGSWHPISILLRKEESEDWDPQQVFTGDDGVDYHVGRLASHARKHMEPVRLPVAKLKHNLVGDSALSADEPLWNKAFRKRAKRSHLKHPLLVQRDADGDHWIMDGAHRLGKAIVRGHKHVNAYVFQTDQMPEHARSRADEAILTRASLLERFASTYDSKKERSFRGGSLNLHTPREGHWLPKRVEPKHHEGIFKKGPKGKRRKRKGSFLRDEPLRHRAEPIRRHVSASLNLTRSKLLAEMDARLRRLQRSVAADPGDAQAVERAHRERLRRGDNQEYAKELNRRIENGDLHHRTIRHYTEALHQAHPEVVEHFNRWVHHDNARIENEKKHDRVRGSLDMNDYNRRSIQDNLPFHKKAQEHENEADSARTNGEREAKLTGHRAVFFLKPPHPSSEGKGKRDRYEKRLSHLSRMHDLISDAYQGSAVYKRSGAGTAELSHHHDESASPAEAHENARIHEAVIKHHFPNAATEIKSRGPRDDPDNHDRHTIHLTNVHALQARGEGA